jgi:hypothetical protein
MATEQETLAAFLTAWPRDRLISMSIDDYCSVGNDDALAYWLEFKTDVLGGIGGGSAYKFGVFKRKAVKEEALDSAYGTDGVYAWAKKYGSTADETFQTIKAGLIEVVDAALRGDSGAIDKMELPPMLKWKAACLYQNQKNPCIIPIYYDSALKYLAFGDPSAKRSLGEAHAALIGKMPAGSDLKEYGESEWARWIAFEGSVAGLIASDGNPWKDEIAEKLKTAKTAVTWWSKNPSGKAIVKNRLKRLVADKGSFPFYFTRNGVVTHRARVIDIAFAADYDDKKASWVNAADYEENWDDYASEDKSPVLAFLIDEMTKLDGSLKPSDFEYWNGYSAPTQDNLQPFVSIRGSIAEDESLEPVSIEMAMLPSKNIIYYGPPGTGKTYFLRSELFGRFTRVSAGKSRERWLIEEADKLPWWKVVAAAFLDAGSSSVPAIAEHEFIRAKIATTYQASPRAMIWAMLQQHTFEDCAFVKYSKRSDPALFRKDAKSVWSVDQDTVKDAIPEVAEFVAKAANYSGAGQSSERNFEFITFHQSMSYEDFIEGIKPRLGEELSDQGLAYEVKDGIFKQICKRARLDPRTDYAIFIDEINRGNVAGVFGELISLIEDDKRAGAVNSLSAILPYSRESFSVPANLYLIGTMNSADRSVEALDTALRRRFSFVEMPPLPEKLKEVEGVDLSKLLESINKRLEALRDRDHRIGHAYLMGIGSLLSLRAAFTDRIIPLLQEYFYGDWAKIGMVLGQSFVKRSSAGIGWPEGFEGDGEAAAAESWAITDSEGWDAAAFVSIYR